MASLSTTKKCFLCCAQNKQIFYKKKLRKKLHYNVFFTDLLSEAEQMLVIGTPDERMTKELVQAKSLKVEVKTITDAELMELEKEELNRERRYASRNRSREYEL